MSEPTETPRKGREKSETGDFRFCEAILSGTIIKEGPERKSSQSGDRIETSIILNPYDARQRKERDRPAFVRVKVFEKSSPEAFAVLEACDRKDRIAVAGYLVFNAWRDRENKIRQGMELVADHILREDRFEPLKTLLEPLDPEPEDGQEDPENQHPDEEHVADSDVPF